MATPVVDLSLAPAQYSLTHSLTVGSHSLHYSPLSYLHHLVA